MTSGGPLEHGDATAFVRQVIGPGAQLTRRPGRQRNDRHTADDRLKPSPGVAAELGQQPLGFVAQHADHANRVAAVDAGILELTGQPGEVVGRGGHVPHRVDGGVVACGRIAHAIASSVVTCDAPTRSR